MEKLSPVLKYPGSKWSMTEWIISNFPDGYENMTYLEPYFGSGAVFFRKNRSQIETINDISDQVVNLFMIIRNRPEELAAAIEMTPWSRTEYRQSYEQTGEPLEDARRFLVRMWQAIGAKTSDITGWRNNIKGNNGNLTQFVNRLPSDIIESSKRLKHYKGCLVQIENQDAIKLIKRHNRSNVLIYADPPYVLSTRAKRIYKNEYTNSDHEQLLEVVKEHSGPVVLSGYDNELYNFHLPGWYKKSLQVKAEGGRDAIETMWCNYNPDKRQMSLII